MSELTSNCVFLICQGRSGSTLLQRLLNQVEDCHICGENFGAILDLATFYQKIVQTNQKRQIYDQFLAKIKNSPTLTKQFQNNSGKVFEQMNVKPSWYNIYNSKQIIIDLRKILLDMYNPHNQYKIWGFKEIRFGLDESNTDKNYSYENFEWEMDFLRLLFPNSKIIFNTREIEAMSQSGWWQKTFNATKILKQQQDYFLNYHYDQDNSSTFHITYEDIVQKSIQLELLFKFLKLDFDIKNYLSVMKHNPPDYIS